MYYLQRKAKILSKGRRAALQTPKDDAPLISTDTTFRFERAFEQTRIGLHAAQGLSPASWPSQRASTMNFVCLTKAHPRL